MTSVADSRAAVRGADVICTATRASAPLFEADDLLPHAHINAVGAYRLDMAEVPAEAFGRAAVVVIDQLAAALAEAGDLVAALEGGYLRRADLVEIGDLLTLDGAAAVSGPAGGGPAGRGLAGGGPGGGGPGGGGLAGRGLAGRGAGPGGGPGGGLTIFKSVGIAAQDWSVCELAVRRAREAGAIPGHPEDGGLASEASQP